MYKRQSFLKSLFSLLLCIIIASNVLVNIQLVMADPGTTITISGTVKYYPGGDSSKTAMPVNHAKVEIWDEEIAQSILIGWYHLPWPDELLQTLYTDENGYFTYTTNNDDGGTILSDEHRRDISVKVFASNGKARVVNNIETFPDVTYKIQTNTWKDIPDGDCSFGNIISGNVDINVAFEIFTISQQGWQFVKDNLDLDLPCCRIFYGDLFTEVYGNSFCLTDLIVDGIERGDPNLIPDWIHSFMNIPGFTGWREITGVHLLKDHMQNDLHPYEVILHEYGHWVNSKIADLSPPFPHAGTHYIDRAYTPDHAWIEGWAEFFSSAARQAAGYPPSEYLSIGSNGDIESNNYKTDSVEGCIAGFLWDCYDNSISENEQCQISFADIVEGIQFDHSDVGGWPVAKDSAWNIYDFFEGYRLTHAYDVSVGQMWSLLDARNIIIEDTEPPSKITGYTVKTGHDSGGNYIAFTLTGAVDDKSGVKYEWDFLWSEHSAGLIFDSSSSTIKHYPLRDGYFTVKIWVRTNDGAGNRVDEDIVECSANVWFPNTISLEATFVNNLGDIFVNSNSVTQKTSFTGKTPLKKVIGGVEYPYSASFKELTLADGPFTLITRDQGGVTIEEVGMTLDNTPPTLDLKITEKFSGKLTYVKQSSTFTVTASDTGTGVASKSYRVNGAKYDSGWIQCGGAFTLSGLKNGEYTLSYKAVDYVGNSKESNLIIFMDNTPPTTNLNMGNPRASNNHITPKTPLTINTSDDSGSGVKSKQTRIVGDNYDHGWNTYQGEFTLQNLDAGPYTIYTRTEDNLGNLAESSLEVLVDTKGPDVEILQPYELDALKGTVTFRVSANDVSGVAEVRLTLRERDSPSVATAVEDRRMVFDVVGNVWLISIKTLEVPKGNYDVIVNAIDTLSNTSSYNSASKTGIKLNGLITFTSERDGNPEIYTMKADGTLQTRLTNNIHSDEMSGWSPDGAKIVFASNRNGNYEIYKMNADGSEQTRLTSNNLDDKWPIWSPDGTKISFSRDLGSNWEIFVMNSDGSEQTRLTSNDNLFDIGTSWSPDGAKILFLSTRDGDFDIYVMNANGSEQTILTNSNYDEELPVWSPDGTKIVYSNGQDGDYEIYVMNADGSGQVRLTNNNYNDLHNSWSPDGTKIIFLIELDDNYEIYSMNTDGSGQTRLTSNKASDVIHGSAWQSLTLTARAAPESKINGKIAFQSDRDGVYEIYSMSPDGSSQTRLTNNIYKEEHPAWSPDGLKIAFSSGRNGNWDIYVINSDGSEETKLTSSGRAGRPSWSPDNSKIAFESNRDGNMEIYVMNADGSGQTRLTNNNSYDSTPFWSPDGSEITFYSNRDGNYEIYVMNPNGSGQTRLTNNIYNDRYSSWSPDGSKIIFVSTRDGNAEIYVMNPDGSGQMRLTNNNYEEGPLSWSPDGAKIAYTSLRDGKWNIYIMNSDGSGETKLTNNVIGLEGDWWPVWQSLSKQTPTFTLQSSSSSTIIDKSFNLNATLSAPRNGQITLYWSIDNSGFIYKQNATMTNGKYSRSIGASTPGIWEFKVVWAGDNEYMGAKSNIIIVSVKPVPVLTSVATVNPVSIYSGGVSKIKVSLTSEGAAIKGASVSLSSGTGGVFSAVTDHGNGTYVATYTAPDVTIQTQYSITVSAVKSGYNGVSAMTQVIVQPLVISIYVKDGDGAPVVGVAVVSTSQPNGQSAISGNTDASGLVTFTGILKGSYTLKASKTGYDDETGILIVPQSQASTEIFTLVKQSSTGGIPGYPLISIVLALLATTIIFYRWKHRALNSRVLMEVSCSSSALFKIEI